MRKLLPLLVLVALAWSTLWTVGQAVRSFQHVVLLNEKTGCTLNYVPEIDAFDWLVLDVAGGVSFTTNHEWAAIDHLMNDCGVGPNYSR